MKNLVTGPDNKLYVDIASSTNSNPIDTTSNPVRSAIYQYDLDGKNGRIFARGIRNAEGFAFVPGTNDLWAAVNESDDILYPFRNSWRDSGSIDYGKKIRSYIDDHPPDEFRSIGVQFRLSAASRGLLNPLGLPGGCLEGIREILCLVQCWSPLGGDCVIRDLESTVSYTSLDVEASFHRG